MPLDLFFEILESICGYDEWLVELAYRHYEREPYTITNEVLDFNNDSAFWLDDWNEGEKDVFVLGAIPIRRIAIHDFPIDFTLELHRKKQYDKMKDIMHNVANIKGVLYNENL